MLALEKEPTINMAYLCGGTTVHVVEIQLRVNFGIVVFRGSFSWAKQFVALIGGGDPRRVA